MKFLLSLLLCMTLFIISGCSDNESQTKVQENSNYAIVDSRGKTITFSEPPKKIVSLNYSATDVLASLIPLDNIIATDKWAKEDDLSNCSEIVKDIPVCEDNVEHVLQYKPDLVIVTEGRGTSLGNMLDSVGVKVCVLRQPKKITEIPDFIRLVGSIVKENNKAETMAKEVEVFFEKQKTHPRVSGVVILHPNGGIGQKNTMGDEICQICNIENLAAGINFPQGSYLGKEQIIGLHPERIIVMDWSFGGQHKNAQVRKEEILADPAYQTLPAIKNKKVVIVPMKYLYCTSQYVTVNLENLITIMETTL